MPDCRDTTWGKGQHPCLIEPKRKEEVPGPSASPDGQCTARQERPLTCSVSVGPAKATRSRVPPRLRSRDRRGSLLFSSSSQRLRLRSRRPGGGERLSAGSGFPRATSCTLRRRLCPGSSRLPPPRDRQLLKPIESLAPPRCGCKDSVTSGVGTILEDPVEGALIGWRGRGGVNSLSCGRLGS